MLICHWLTVWGSTNAPIPGSESETGTGAVVVMEEIHSLFAVGAWDRRHFQDGRKSEALLEKLGDLEAHCMKAP